MAQNVGPGSIASNLGSAAPYVIALTGAAFGVGIGLCLKEENEKDRRKSGLRNLQAGRAH